MLVLDETIWNIRERGKLMETESIEGRRKDKEKKDSEGRSKIVAIIIIL